MVLASRKTRLDSLSLIFHPISAIVCYDKLATRTTPPIPFTLAAAAVILFAASPAEAFTHYKDDGSCQIVGDTDIYGIGVRVGYYFTFFAGVLAIGFNNRRGTTDRSRLSTPSSAPSSSF